MRCVQCYYLPIDGESLLPIFFVCLLCVVAESGKGYAGLERGTKKGRVG